MWNDEGVSHVIVTNGVKSIAYSEKDGGKVYSIIPSDNVVDVTGAGGFILQCDCTWLAERLSN